MTAEQRPENSPEESEEQPRTAQQQEVDKEINRYGFGIPAVRKKLALKRLKKWWAEHNADIPFPEEGPQLDALIRREILAKKEEIRTQAGQVLRYGRPSRGVNEWTGETYYDESDLSPSQADEDAAKAQQKRIKATQEIIFREMDDMIWHDKRLIQEALLSPSRKPQYQFVYDRIDELAAEYDIAPKTIEEALFYTVLGGHKEGRLFPNKKLKALSKEQAQEFVEQADIRTLREVVSTIDGHSRKLKKISQQIQDLEKEITKAYLNHEPEEDIQRMKETIWFYNSEQLREMGRESDTIRRTLRDENLSPDACHTIATAIEDKASKKFQAEANRIANALMPTFGLRAAEKVLKETEKALKSIDHAFAKKMPEEQRRREDIVYNWVRGLCNNQHLVDYECSTILEAFEIVLPSIIRQKKREKSRRARKRRRRTPSTIGSF